MPGLLQYKADLQLKEGPPQVPEHPDDIGLWLPSQIPRSAHSRVCSNKLSAIEDKLCTAQCYDALNNLQHVLKIKSHLILFKNKNVRGQREGNRSRAVIDHVRDRARVAAEKYRAAHVAKLHLVGVGDWEKVLKVLADADIRGYQDSNQLRKRVGQRGVWEDGHVPVDGLLMEESNATETSDFALFKEA